MPFPATIEKTTLAPTDKRLLTNLDSVWVAIRLEEGPQVSLEDGSYLPLQATVVYPGPVSVTAGNNNAVLYFSVTPKD